MTMNFETLLAIIVLITAFISAMDLLWLRHRRQSMQKKPWLVEYSVALFPVLFVVLVIRSFLFEPFHIPSSSLEPTLLQGDFILVNKYDYGLRLPITDEKIVAIGEPKIGDIVVFHYPLDPNIDYIKRIVALPGDSISYINKVLYINGVAEKQTPLGFTMDSDGANHAWLVQRLRENLNGVQHDIYLNPQAPVNNFFNIVVPEHMYFVMGDNRDDSQDSRYWGFLPEKNLVGRAFLIWFSWNNTNTDVRWDRIGRRIH